MILLGIGFIMIAGIFPVAIQQTAAVTSETQGSAVIRDAIKKIQAAANAEIGSPPATPGTTNSIFQPTGTAAAPTVQAFSSNIMQVLGSDSFYTADRRFGWVGFYRRDSASSPFTQVFVIALQNPNFPNYVTKFAPGEVTPIAAGSIPPVVAPPIPPLLYNYSGSTPPVLTYNPPASGVPASLVANFTYDPNDKTSTVKLTNVPSAAPGAFVLIGAPGSAAFPAQSNMIGRFFRLGIALPTTPASTINQTFSLQPGWDLTDADLPSLTNNRFSAAVFVIGAAPTVGANGEYTGPFTGPNQDIAAGSAFIRVNTSNN